MSSPLTPSTPGYYANTGINQDAFNIKKFPGVIAALLCINTTAIVYYLKIYDTNTAPTASLTPVLIIPVPANSSVGAGFAWPLPTGGLQFNSGIAFRMTTSLAIGSGDTGNVPANSLVLNWGVQ